jgi:hypothetical protein
MSLSLLTREHKLTHSSAGDLALVSGVFVLALTYLEVPFWNALLFGPAITLQAAVGVVVLTRLLKGVPGSLLLLVGPGLILGGALSFAAFQLVGRGMVGLLAVLAIGVGAVVTLIKATAWQPLFTSRMWTLGQILGLAALALTWEFPELLPVAVAFFTLGFFTSESSKTPRWLALTVGILTFVAMAIVPLLRQDYWWLITDDYQFFEVLSVHITKSGPLADWGVGNWGSYHWLSYGWSGLLDVLGGNPETFTTITRVMPLTYSTALAASLILITSTLRHDLESFALILVPVWAVLAISRLDWSGLSTAGVYAVIAATVATATLALNTNQIFTRRIGVYLCFTPVIALTKLPSIFAVALLALVFEISACSRDLLPKTRILVLLAAAGAGVVMTIPLLTALSNLIGSFQIVGLNPQLGQLSETSVRFAFFALLARNLIVIAPALVACVRLLTVDRDRATLEKASGLLALVPLTLFGAWLDVNVSGNANAHEYFSGPMYFVGLLLIIYPITTDCHNCSNTKTHGSLAISTGGLVLAGLAWTELNLIDAVWSSLGQQLLQLSDIEIALMQYFSADMRIGASTVALVGLPLLAIFRKSSIGPYLLGLLMSITILTFLSYSEGIRSQYSGVRSDNEIAAIIGSPDAQEVGTWIRLNTNVSEIIATNLLYEYETCRPLSDFSLASWSQREFLVLGPRFGLVDESSYTESVLLSLDFAANPNSDFISRLQRNNVEWFIVDKWNSSIVDWRRDWDVEYENERFLVVKI